MGIRYKRVHYSGVSLYQVYTRFIPEKSYIHWQLHSKALYLKAFRIYQHDFSSPKLFQSLIILYSKIQFNNISDLTAKNTWSLEGRYIKLPLYVYHNPDRKYAILLHMVLPCSFPLCCFGLQGVSRQLT